MRRTATCGFTLLEITVTLAILGVVFSIVYGVFSQTVAGKELAERRGDEADVPLARGLRNPQLARVPGPK
ncbi:MAG TPA: prepilin-type N-terminal cleavage/methylation domain-containing protein [Candidatus Binatia bacterium]|nr:prepilin-type N-terminal cleavage/methylation domain-containing protein [Candidatus Binatia bacterium]